MPWSANIEFYPPLFLPLYIKLMQCSSVAVRLSSSKKSILRHSSGSSLPKPHHLLPRPLKLHTDILFVFILSHFPSSLYTTTRVIFLQNVKEIIFRIIHVLPIMLELNV